jgi:MoxR-like ATPase
MQEGRVTAAGVDMALPRPFFVLATQNPIEQEGTYPLPEAQLDRFMLNVRMTYPDLSDEVRVLMTTTGVEAADISAVLDADEVLALQRTVREVEVAADVFQYVAELVRATRPTEASSPEEIRRWVRWGAGPRAGQSLILSAKARALLEGRVHVSPADVRRLAAPVLRHRVLLNFHAEADGTTTDDVVDLLLDRIRAPRAVP